MPKPAAGMLDAAIAYELKTSTTRRSAKSALRGLKVRRAGADTHAERGDVTAPARTMSAIETHELSKDYFVGFWRPRPYRALRRADPRRRARRGLRLSRAERRRQDDHAQAADAAGLSDRRAAPRSSAARSATVDVKRRIGYLPENPYFYDYLTAEELLELLRRPLRLPRRRAPAARGPAARRGRPGRRAPHAAAQVLEGDDPARRARAGARQRPRGGVPRRADVRPRSAGAPRRARS